MCLICDRIAMITNGTNPYFVKELQSGYVVIGDNQHFIDSLTQFMPIVASNKKLSAALLK